MDFALVSLVTQMNFFWLPYCSIMSGPPLWPCWVQSCTVVKLDPHGDLFVILTLCGLGAPRSQAFGCSLSVFCKLWGGGGEIKGPAEGLVRGPGTTGSTGSRTTQAWLRAQAACLNLSGPWLPRVSVESIR